MGIWDYTGGDLVKGITRGKSTVKRAGNATYRCTSAAVTRISQVVSTRKLPQYLPDDEKKAQIAVFTTTFAKNAGKYAIHEGFKHIPGATVASKLVSDTMRDVEQQNKKDGMKSTSQPESSTENSKLSSQDSVKDESKKDNMARSRM